MEAVKNVQTDVRSAYLYSAIDGSAKKANEAFEMLQGLLHSLGGNSFRRLAEQYKYSLDKVDPEILDEHLSVNLTQAVGMMKATRELLEVAIEVANVALSEVGEW